MVFFVVIPDFSKIRDINFIFKIMKFLEIFETCMNINFIFSQIIS